MRHAPTNGNQRMNQQKVATMATTPSRRRLNSAGEPLLSSIPEDSSEERKKRTPSFHGSLSREIKTCHRRIPFGERAANAFARIPRKLRMLLLVGWLLWKVTITILFIRLIWKGANIQSSPWSHHFGLTSSLATESELLPPTRILYIVTALAEYNNGQRQTVKGQDRLGEVLIPVLVDSVESLVSYDYHVDVFLILGYTLRPERRQDIEARLPAGVGLEVWDDATPLGYPDDAKSKQTMELNTRALSRQHRFVVKDKLLQYDLFQAWEDDIRITGAHVQHFLRMSIELQRLYDEAPEQVDGVPETMEPPQRQTFFGQMTKRQMKRLIPGFVRVEVLLDYSTNFKDTKSPIPLDYAFPEGERHFDASICCHVPDMEPNRGIPKRPDNSDILIWETNVTALSLREIPGSSILDWVVLLPGPGKGLEADDMIGGYWTGRDGAFGDFPKPSPGQPRLVAQQGGWMATRQQIIHLNSGQCQGSFLPPFDAPFHAQDGHFRKNVEFWSGGYQFFTGVRGGCNMQRLISFHPDDFSKHFIYHTANNKQKQLSTDRLVRADTLFGQLNSVKKAAERTEANMMKQ